MPNLAPDPAENDAAAVTPVLPLTVDQALVLKKCTDFVDFQLWPLNTNLNPEAWLPNFGAAEIEHAVHLLNSFMYFSETLVDHIFASAFRNLSNLLFSTAGTFSNTQKIWAAFVRQVLVTYVTGEVPNASDSGYLFARKARQVLQLPENQIVTPPEALEVLTQNPSTPIVFVDDFVGSGNQFIATWERKYQFASQDLSFSDLSIPGPQVFYCPAFCTEYGLGNINRKCPTVAVNAGNFLSKRYSALDVELLVWPEHLRSSASDFLRTASERAGIPDTNGAQDDWRGFHKLGLAIAFSHSVPDATIPLFYWEQNGWSPLVHRR